MNKINKLYSFVLPIMIILLLVLTITEPNVCLEGVKKGLIISGEIIIPSLFPFCVCVNYLMRCGITDKLKIINNSELLIAFIFSLIGGYPVGANILENLCKEKRITEKTAEKMVFCFVNSGPAFIVIAVGGGIFGNKKIGYVLLFSHIFISFLMFLVLKKGIEETKNQNITPKNQTFAQDFTEATADAAAAVFSICSGVVLFSGLNSVLNMLFSNFASFKKILLLNEITYAVSHTENIYEISFLLGFGGLCVWFQIISTVKSFRINFLLFALFRAFHGVLSVIVTYLILKLIPIKIETISNVQNAAYFISEEGITAAISIVLLSVIWIVSLFRENNGRNLLKDIV